MTKGRTVEIRGEMKNVYYSNKEDVPRGRIALEDEKMGGDEKTSKEKDV